MTVFSVKSQTNIEQIHKVNLSELGGNIVNRRFWSFLEELCGVEFIQKCIDDGEFSEKDVMDEFELKKKVLTRDAREVRIRLPIQVLDRFREQFKIGNCKLPAKYEGKINCSGDKLVIQSEIVKEMFEKVCNAIGKELQKLTSNPKMSNLDTVIMVGGFAESYLLQNAVRTNIQNLIIPEDPEFAVVKGAVLYGHNPGRLSGTIR